MHTHHIYTPWLCFVPTHLVTHLPHTNHYYTLACGPWPLSGLPPVFLYALLRRADLLPSRVVTFRLPLLFIPTFAFAFIAVRCCCACVTYLYYRHLRCVPHIRDTTPTPPCPLFPVLPFPVVLHIAHTDLHDLPSPFTYGCSAAFFSRRLAPHTAYTHCHLPRLPHRLRAPTTFWLPLCGWRYRCGCILPAYRDAAFACPHLHLPTLPHNTAAGCTVQVLPPPSPFPHPTYLTCALDAVPRCRLPRHSHHGSFHLGLADTACPPPFTPPPCQHWVLPSYYKKNAERADGLPAQRWFYALLTFCNAALDHTAAFLPLFLRTMDTCLFWTTVLFAVAFALYCCYSVHCICPAIRTHLPAIPPHAYTPHFPRCRATLPALSVPACLFALLLHSTWVMPVYRYTRRTHNVRITHYRTLAPHLLHHLRAACYTTGCCVAALPVVHAPRTCW